MRFKADLVVKTALLVVFLTFAREGSTHDILPSGSATFSNPKRAETLSDTLKIEPRGSRLGKGELREPLGISVDPRGVIYVADAMAGKVFRFTDDGESTEFEAPAGFGSIYPIDVAGSGTFVYVLDYASNKVLRFDYRGAYLDVLISFEEYDDLKPVSMTLEPGGRISLTDIQAHSVTIMNPLLDIELQIGEYGWSPGFFDRPMKSVIMPDGRIAVTDMGNKRVQVFSPSGAFLDTLGTVSNEICSPRSICADDRGNLFLADTECRSILVFSAEGKLESSIDSYMGSPIYPAALSVGLEDILYVADLRSRSIISYRLIYPENQR